jgi:hypothetical protein
MKFEIAPKSTEIRSNWDDARLYCFSLDIGGKSGWRLPTNEELNEIYKSGNDFASSYYWTSVEITNILADALSFRDGSRYAHGKSSDNIRVRAVRDIKDN